MAQKKNIVGLSMKGGKRDNFFFCLLEYFSDEKRWFLKSLLQVKDEEGLTGDEAIRSWIDQYQVWKMVVDFPLSLPACSTCLIECPGSLYCPEPSVAQVRQKIEDLLEHDKKLQKENPKKYEQDRNLDDLFEYDREILSGLSTDDLMSRPFKRKLKKGFIPYWNRAIDFWVWCRYYNQLLELFNLSFDSFGSTSLMVQSRFSYLRRHFPKELELFESHGPLILIELLRAGIILKKDIQNLSDIEMGVEGRLDIIKRIEKKFNFFIYDHDLEILIKNSRAFDSFLLAIAGQNKMLELNAKLPDWTRPDEVGLIAPCF